MSHPSWVCGLKPWNQKKSLLAKGHTLRGCVDWNLSEKLKTNKICCHTLRGCVDWNIYLLAKSWGIIASHPSWVCGLKLRNEREVSMHQQSHPSWVCGLKPHGRNRALVIFKSHPSWVCGLKHREPEKGENNTSSHPSWVCGLKPTCGCSAMIAILSHTLRGCVDWNFCWVDDNFLVESHTLRGCVDWNLAAEGFWSWGRESHPSWVCGLKPYYRTSETSWRSHTLRGCVDWNCDNCLFFYRKAKVTPFVGVWIETLCKTRTCRKAESHPSWVCGLKLSSKREKACEHQVTPFVGVWIETLYKECSCKVH